MTIASLICEWNPFHSGHEYLLRKMREQGAEGIVACMSGNFTQRGEPAIYEKQIRASIAVRGGADLVIELPVTYACAGAERFAWGGVYLLQALGCVDQLWFGSECGDLTLLQQTASAQNDRNVQERIRQSLGNPSSFAALREGAVREVYGDEIAGVLREPNNILAVEYLRALMTLHSDIKPFTLRRIGSGHDSGRADGNIASASLIRELIRSGQDYRAYVPDFAVTESTEDYRQSALRWESAMYYRLKTMTPQEYACLPEMSEGLENRLYKAAQCGGSVEEILSYAKCKRYPLARLRRALLHAFLQLTKDDFLPLPPYIGVLAFNQTGQNILRQMKRSAVLPVITRQSDVNRLSPEARDFLERQRRCDTIRHLFH